MIIRAYDLPEGKGPVLMASSGSESSDSYD